MNPSKLKILIEQHGSELAKQDAGLSQQAQIDVSLIPGAEIAAGIITQIDDLMRDGKDLLAIRKYRELTGKFWDACQGDIRKWRDLTYAEKLSLLGCETKGSRSEKLSTGDHHPLFDGSLDH